MVIFKVGLPRETFYTFVTPSPKPRAAWNRFRVMVSYGAFIYQKNCPTLVYTFLMVPIGAWSVPEGSRRLNLPDFIILGTQRW